MKKRYRYPLAYAGLTALVLATAFEVDAGFLTFSDRDSWESGLNGGVNAYNFNSFSVDTSFASSALNFGAFSLSTIGSAPIGSNLIETDPFPDGSPPIDGTPYARMFLDSTHSVAITFDSPLKAFGGTFLGSAMNFGVFLLDHRGPEFIGGPGGRDSFFGFISTEAFNRIELRFDGPKGSSADVRFDNALLASTVPEPSSLLMLGMGGSLLSIFGLWRLRRSGQGVDRGHS